MSFDPKSVAELAKCPVTIEFPIAWGDMDAFQHVNNVTYFRYFESARIAYFDQVGINESMKADNIGPILAETQCRFKAPMTYPDTITVGATISEISEDRFTMEYYVVSHKLKRVAAQGTGLIVFYDYNQGVKAAIPDAIKAQIDQLQNL